MSSGLAKIGLHGKVKRTGRKGRQKKRWEDNVKEWAGVDSSLEQLKRRPFRVLGKELGHEVPTSQMQHNAYYKETDQKDQCFL